MLDFIFAVDRLFHRNLKKVHKDYWVTLLALVLPLLSITPLSISYTTYAVVAYIRAWQLKLLPTWLHIICLVYCLLETASFIYLWTTWARKRRPTSGPQLEEETILSTLSKIFAVETEFLDEVARMDKLRDDVELEAAVFRQRFTGWFYKARFETIKRDNVLDWLGWTTYNSMAAALTPSQFEVCENLLRMLEDRCKRTFPDGRNKSVRSLRLTLDPIPFVPRPLLFYVVVYICNAFMLMYLYRQGFTKIKVVTHGFVFEYYHRPASLHTSTRKHTTPLLFIHGLGMGLAQYRAFIRSMLEVSMDREIFLLAQGQISMMPTHRNYCNPPTASATCQALDEIAQLHRISQKGGWTVLSHSFGSIPHAWMIKNLSTDVLHRSIMVDPVCFRLWECDVCYNFLYRRPRNAVQLVIAYFVGKELGIAYSLHRAFWWSENLLMPEDIERAHTRNNFVAFLGAKDEIINSISVHQYLSASGTNTALYDNYSHGQLLNTDHAGAVGLHDVLSSLQDD